jgi:Trk K+ transport system NAD-binding subunit
VGELAELVGASALSATDQRYLIETRISDDSGSAGRALADVALPPGTVVATVIRNGQPSVPSPDHRTRPGDTLLLVSPAGPDLTAEPCRTARRCGPVASDRR